MLNMPPVVEEVWEEYDRLQISPSEKPGRQMACNMRKSIQGSPFLSRGPGAVSD